MFENGRWQSEARERPPALDRGGARNVTVAGLEIAKVCPVEGADLRWAVGRLSERTEHDEAARSQAKIRTEHDAAGVAHEERAQGPRGVSPEFDDPRREVDEQIGIPLELLGDPIGSFGPVAEVYRDEDRVRMPAHEAHQLPEERLEGRHRPSVIGPAGMRGKLFETFVTGVGGPPECLGVGGVDHDGQTDLPRGAPNRIEPRVIDCHPPAVGIDHVQPEGLFDFEGARAVEGGPFEEASRQFGKTAGLPGGGPGQVRGQQHSAGLSGCRRLGLERSSRPPAGQIERPVDPDGVEYLDRTVDFFRGEMDVGIDRPERDRPQTARQREPKPEDGQGVHDGGSNTIRSMPTRPNRPGLDRTQDTGQTTKTMLEVLRQTDPEIYETVLAETRRQREGLELIASENFTSPAVMEAMGSTLTNKYAEGLPGKRYYGGCQHVDVVERLAIERAKALFDAEAANVQPHSGAQANMAVYFAVLKPGEKYVAMNLSEGGHLTHGSPVNFSGRLYEAVAYGVHPETHRIQYDEIHRLLKEHRPKLLVAGASAYPRVIDFERLGSMARDCGVRLMTDIAHIAGLVVAGEHPSPIPHADFVTTTTHKTLRGPRGGLILMRQDDAKVINSRVFPGMQGGPLMHVIAAKAVSFLEAQSDAFRAYQRQTVRNAKAMAEAFLQRGYTLVSGGTDNHLVLLDVRSKGLTGKIAEEALGQADITVNKNMIPGDPESPFVTSGVRLGTPALTTRGMKEDAMEAVVALIDRALGAVDQEGELARTRQAVHELTDQFPLYPGWPV